VVAFRAGRAVCVHPPQRSCGCGAARHCARRVRCAGHRGKRM